MRYYSFLGLLLFVFLSSPLFAVTKTSNGGSWATNGTWSPSGVPAATDDVILASGTTTIDNSFTSGSTVLTLTINGTAILNYANNNKTLNVSGAFIMNGNSQITGGGNNQILNANSTFAVPASQTATIGGITFNVASTTTISGYFTMGTSASGNKVFNGTITVNSGGTWDNTVGEDPFINCNIVNNGSWPAPTGGTGNYTISVNGTSYTYTGSQPINFTQFSLTGGTGTTITNLTTLILSRTGTGNNSLSVGNGRTFNNGDGTTAGTLILSGDATITGGGTINFANALNTVDYTFAGAQSIYTTTYNILKASTSGTKSLGGNVQVNTEVNVSGTAVLDAATNSLTGSANLVMTGTSEISYSRTTTTLPETTGTANSLAAGTTITFYGSGTQTAKGSSAVNPSTTATFPYQNVNLSGNNAASVVDMSNVTLINGNLVFSNRGRMSNNPVMTVKGTFNFGPSTSTTLANNITVADIIFTGGTLNYSNRTITVNGNGGAWTNNGGVSFVNSSSVVAFTTGTGQQIKGTTSTVFTGLTINNSNGVTLGSVDIQVAGTLTFTSGNLITGTNNVYLPTPATVSRTSGFVQGNLQKDVAAATSTPTFEVGTGTTYAPVSLIFTSITVAGIVTCSSTGTAHPFINSSNIEPAKSVIRYWTLSNSGVAYTDFSATFNFGAGEIGSGNTANFNTKWTTNGLTWSTTTPGTRTSTSTQMVTEPSTTLPNSGISVDFACGEQIITTGFINRVTGTNSWNNKATWIQNRTGTATFNSTVNVVGSGTLFTTELAVNDIIMLQTTAGTIQGTVASITDATHLTLTAVAASSASGGYGREKIPGTSSGDAVTIGNSNITNATTTIQYDVPTASLINSLTINSAASPLTTAQSVTHTATTLLTIQTNVTINQPGASLTDAWNINTGQASVLGTLSIGSAVNSATRIAQVNVTTGTLSVGNIFFNTSNNSGVEAATVLNVSSTGTINMSGSMSFANNRGLLTPGTTSTFNFNGTSNQLLVFPSSNSVTFAYGNLTFNNTAANGVLVSPPGQLLTTSNVTGNVNVQTGSFVTSDNTTITGNATKTFTVTPGATFRMTGSASTFPTGFGTFSLGTTGIFGTVSYEQTNSVLITTQPYGHLNLLSSGASGASYAIPNTNINVAGNLTVGDGSSSFTVIQSGTGGSTLSVTGNLLINTGATIDASSNNRLRTISVGGNWTNNGTFLPSTASGDTGLTFIGTGPSQPQVIGGTSSEAFFRVAISTGSATNIVQLAKSISFTSSANSRLTLSQGGLDLNGNTLTLLNTATSAMTGGATGAYIKSENTSAPYGTITWTVSSSTGSYVFPFGKSATQYIPVTYNVTSAGAPNGSSVSISTYASATNNTPFPTTVTNLNGTTGGNSVADRFWVLSTTGYATTKPVATLTFTAVGTNAIPPSEKPGSIANIATVTTSPAGIAGQRWNSSGYWDPALSSQTFANNAPNTGFFQVTVPAVTMQSFSPWALADISAALPISLKNFTAVVQSDRVNLEWDTETELNNALFTVQKTMDGEDFRDVAQVNGAGTTADAKHYSTIDYRPGAGIWYYRLKQTDFDGNFTFSKLVRVDVSERQSWIVYPNPSNGSSFNIQFGENDLGKTANVKIQDVGGKEVMLASAKLISTNLQMTTPQTLSPGIYIISIIVDQNIVRQKLVVH